MRVFIDRPGYPARCRVGSASPGGNAGAPPSSTFARRGAAELRSGVPKCKDY